MAKCEKTGIIRLRPGGGHTTCGQPAVIRYDGMWRCDEHADRNLIELIKMSRSIAATYHDSKFSKAVDALTKEVGDEPKSAD